MDVTFYFDVLKGYMRYQSSKKHILTIDKKNQSKLKFLVYFCSPYFFWSVFFLNKKTFGHRIINTSIA